VASFVASQLVALGFLLCCVAQKYFVGKNQRVSLFSIEYGSPGDGGHARPQL